MTSFPAPHSYTGEDVVEVSAHGSPVLAAGNRRLGDRGGRTSLRSRASLRSGRFSNGRMDLVQAEAVRDLVEAVTPAQARAAFDQLEGTLTERIQVDR